MAGYSEGHSIHKYSFAINGLVKPFFKGDRLWVKLVCRSCERLIQSFRLGCECYLGQKQHSHLYNKGKCLNCAGGDYVRRLSEGDLKQKYSEYCQSWRERAEIQADLAIKQAYRYDGERYWTRCNFCGGEIRGRQKDKGALSRNKVGFWTEDFGDERVICGGCLRNKRLVGELGIKGIRRQMLWNYRLKKII